MVPVGEGNGLMRWAILSGILMVSGEIWGWTGLTGDSSTFLASLLSLDRAVNEIFILVLGNRKQHLWTKITTQSHDISVFSEPSQCFCFDFCWHTAYLLLFTTICEIMMMDNINGHLDAFYNVIVETNRQATFISLHGKKQIKEV